jgi:acyl-CoA synthetase (AMP-forming)/AMP-acid ligase II
MNEFLGGRPLVRIDKVNGCDFVKSLADIWQSGAIAVAMDTGMPIEAAGVEATELRHVRPGGGWIRPHMPRQDPELTALVSFTSGTTGAPKAIIISHGALADVTERLVAIMEMDPSIREYVAVPVIYSFGAGRMRAIAEVGGSAFVPDHGFRVEQFAQMLGAGEVNALAAVPSMLRILLAQQYHFEKCGPKLEWMEIGSQYMAAAEKKALRQLFPHARIVQHYGLTEASRSTFLVVSSCEESRLETVGHPTGNVEIRVDSEGVILIRGPHVATGRLVGGTVEPITDPDGWLRTSDLGKMDDGFLTYLGRTDDVANIAGIKVSADHFEQTLLEKVRLSNDQVAVAVGDDPVRGQCLLIGFTADVERRYLTPIVGKVASANGLGAADFRLQEVPSVPRTETGKVRRAELAQTIQRSVPRPATPQTLGELSPSEAKLAAVWSEILGISEIHSNDSFFDLGGDSLSAVTVALRAEQEGMSPEVLKHMFEGRTLREIVLITDGTTVVQAPPSRRAQLSLAINSARGVLVLMVIGAHWLPFFYERTGALGEWLGHWLAPVFHLGTPGFSIIFGVGLVFFYRPLMIRTSDNFQRKLRTNSLLLAGGVLIQALVTVSQQAVEVGSLSDQWPEQAFYTILLFYLLMVPTAGLWLRIIYRGEAPALNALLIAITSGMFFSVVQRFWPLGPGDPWIRLLHHMVVAPYAYPLLLAAVCTGISIGIWVERNSQSSSFSLMATKLGLALLIGGAAAVALFTEGWWVMAQTPAAIPAYSGAVILLIATMNVLTSRGISTVSVRLLAVIGLLAFPAFVTHAVVIPGSRILVGLSVPYPLAILVSVALFVIASACAVRKLYKMLFVGGSSQVSPMLDDGIDFRSEPRP